MVKDYISDVALVCRFDAVIHFAGRKAVGESVKEPMLYYTHNVIGAVNLIEAMRKNNVKNVSCLTLQLQLQIFSKDL